FLGSSVHTSPVNSRRFTKCSLVTRLTVNLFHPPVSRVWRTWMALASCPAFQGQQRSLRRMRQVLSWALARSPGPRSVAWARLAAFCEAGLFLPLYGVRM